MGGGPRVGARGCFEKKEMKGDLSRENRRNATKNSFKYLFLNGC